MKVLIINQCSTNKGDRAILYFMLRELKANGIKEVTVSASNPQYWHDTPDYPDMTVRIVSWGWDVSRKKGVGFFSKVFHLVRKVKLPRLIYFPLVRRALLAGRRPWYLHLFINRQFLEALRQADLVISVGGHHLTSIIAKSIRTPQIFDMAVTLLYEKPLVLWSQSVGTFDFKSSACRQVIQKIISGAKQIYIRDKASADEILKLGVHPENISNTFESVFGLYDVAESRIAPSNRTNVMGVSVWTGNKQTTEAWEHYIQCLAGLIEHAIKAGYKVRFFPMEMQGSDRSCIEDIINTLGAKESCEIVEGFPNTVAHIKAVAECKLFVGHKTHSQIFSLVAATPLLGIAYHKKTEDFMSQFGLEKYCIADTQLSSIKLIEIFDRLVEKLDVISLKQQEVAYRMSEQVKKDFADMLENYIQT